MKNKLIIFLNIVLLNSISLINSAFKVEKRVKIQQTTQQKMREKCFWGGRQFQFATNELTPSEVILNSLTKKFGDYKKFSVDEILQCLEFANKEIRNEDKNDLIKLIAKNLLYSYEISTSFFEHPIILEKIIKFYPQIINQNQAILFLFFKACKQINDKKIKVAKILLMNGMDINAHEIYINEYGNLSLQPLEILLEAYVSENKEYLNDLKEIFKTMLDKGVIVEPIWIKFLDANKYACLKDTQLNERLDELQKIIIDFNNKKIIKQELEKYFGSAANIVEQYL